MKNEYTITYDLIRTWAKEYRLYGARNVLLFVLWCVLGLCGLLGLCAAILLRMHAIYIVLSVLYLAVSVYKLFVSRFVVWRQRYLQYVRSYGVREWRRSYVFLDTEIVCTDHTTVAHIRYESIQKIQENGNVVFLLLDTNGGIRLYKDAFTEGSWEECKALLDERVSR